MTASLDRIFSVVLQQQSDLLQPANPNDVLIVTAETGFLSSEKRFEAYTSQSQVENDFGAASETAQFASTVFGSDPNPIDGGGRLIVGFHRNATENVAAKPATLISEALNETLLVSTLQQISDGSFDIDIDGTTVAFSGLDFRAVVNLNGVVQLLQNQIVGGVVSLVANKIVIKSSTTGVLSTLTYATNAGSGTFVGALLGLSENNGSDLLQGVDATTLSPETQIEAISEIFSQRKFRGAMFIDGVSDVPNMASWAAANNVLVYMVFSDPSNLEIDVTNPVWNVKTANQKEFRCLYSKNGNQRLAAAYMARLHTVDFQGISTAITMQLKQLNVPAEIYSESELDSAEAVGIDVYTTISNSPGVLSSGSNGYADSVYNAAAFKSEVQVDAFNLLKGSATKIPQLQSGVDQLSDVLESTCQRYINNGVGGARPWTGSDTFGDKETFNRNIEIKGYYVLIGSLADQSQASSQARETPPISIALQGSGAFHSGTILIQFTG